jgi:hypothetical protein
MLCQECPNRPLCSSLCPEAELYLKEEEAMRDFINLGVAVFGKSTKGDIDEIEEKRMLDQFYSLPTKEQVSRLLDAGYTRQKICKALNITRTYLRKIIQKLPT